MHHGRDASTANTRVVEFSGYSRRCPSRVPWPGRMTPNDQGVPDGVRQAGQTSSGQPVESARIQVTRYELVPIPCGDALGTEAGGAPGIRRSKRIGTVVRSNAQERMNLSSDAKVGPPGVAGARRPEASFSKSERHSG